LPTAVGSIPVGTWACESGGSYYLLALQVDNNGSIQALTRRTVERFKYFVKPGILELKFKAKLARYAWRIEPGRLVLNLQGSSAASVERLPQTVYCKPTGM
jgi:hypothetical protein